METAEDLHDTQLSGFILDFTKLCNKKRPLSGRFYFVEEEVSLSQHSHNFTAVNPKPAAMKSANTSSVNPNEAMPDEHGSFLQIISIRIHYFYPSLDKIIDELLLVVILRIYFGIAAQNRV